MRIIAGKYKRHNLLSVKGNTARPTTDFLRETLFNLTENPDGKRFLDLYAGSGAVGLEAISRGAAFCCFVEFSMNSLHTIRQNIESLNCHDKCRILRRNVIKYLSKNEECYDLIFLDPPYNKGLVKKTLEALKNTPAVTKDTEIIIEHSQEEKIPLEWREKIILSRIYGGTELTILKSVNLTQYLQ